MASSEYLRKVAAEDFYMCVCRRYSESSSPFGHVDCKVISNALRTAFTEEMGPRDAMEALPRGVLGAVLRSFLGSGCSYEQQLCTILGNKYASGNGVHDADALLGDFAAALSGAQRGASSSGAGFLSKVDLRKCLVEWIASTGGGVPRGGAAPFGGKHGAACLPALLGGTPACPSASSSPRAASSSPRAASSSPRAFMAAAGDSSEPPPAPGSPRSTTRLTRPTSTPADTAAVSCAEEWADVAAGLRSPPRSPKRSGHTPAVIRSCSPPRSVSAGLPTMPATSPTYSHSYNYTQRPPPLPPSVGVGVSSYVATSTSFTSSASPTRFGSAGARGVAGRENAVTLTATLEQALAQSRENERHWQTAEEAVREAEARLSSVQVEARRDADARASLQAELDAARRENAGLAQQSHEMGRRVRDVEAAAAARQAELQDEVERLSRAHAQAEGGLRELEARTQRDVQERASLQSAGRALEERCAHLEDELGRARAEHAQLQQQLEAERHAAAASAQEAVARAQADAESLRLELTSRLHAEQEGVARLREEIRQLRAELERLQQERARMQASFEAAAAHAEDMHRAAMARLESKFASEASQAALELERLRQEKTAEAQRQQKLLTDAKEETARAKAETLQAREDALHWQRRTAP